MREQSVSHATFVVERVYPAEMARIFAAWADAKVKARWFGPPEEGVELLDALGRDIERNP